MSIYGAFKKQLTGLSFQKKELIAKCLGGREGVLLRTLRAKAKHDEIYDEKYYKHVEQGMAHSAKVMAETLMAVFKPETLIDIGCGSGALLGEFKLRGINVQGLEYSSAAIQICEKRGLLVQRFDLESGVRIPPAAKYDLCISTEVAEHLPAVLAGVYVETLCGHSDVCVITAATPGQGGTDHVNEQPHEYWINLFTSHNFSYDSKQSEFLRKTWKDGGAEKWYWKNALVFIRNEKQHGK